ncbi:MAG: nucleotide-binding protein [Lachnospiraceae bacterium]|nr:nucleotide-binding protein [Lachnospiraceae bacterium]
MIRKYSKIAIIYGGTGKKLAHGLGEQISKMHKDNQFPMQPMLLEKSILNSDSIMSHVIGMVHESSLCVIIFTFDDADQTRVRQNVLIETGIAWSLKGKEKCIFLSNLLNLPDDFPSNIKTEININYFDADDFSERAVQVSNEIIDILKLEDTRKQLVDENYYYDGKILDDIPEEILEKKSDVQLHEILNEWDRNIKSFDYLPERAMYLLERIAFIPIFSNDECLDKFLSDMREQIKQSPDDLVVASADRYMEECRSITVYFEQLIEYTQIKTESEARKVLASPSEYPDEAKALSRRYARIASSLEELIEEYDMASKPYNWLVRVVAYDYSALARMKVYELRKGTDVGKESLEIAISNFEMAAKIAKKYDLASNHIWLGFIDYNLSRAYRYHYELTGYEKDLDRFEETLADSIDIRKGWYKRNAYPGVFGIAMSYEYFIASKLDYEMRNDIDEYTHDSPSQNLANIERLMSELNGYCRDTELGKLYEARDSIDALMNRIRSEHSL